MSPAAASHHNDANGKANGNAAEAMDDGHAAQ